jgi:asparagine synthase (glutamine-hydrolysing)
MPGIIFNNNSLPVESWTLLKHEPWLEFQQNTTWEDIYIGRVSNGIFNPGTYACDERYIVFVDGELSGRQKLWKRLNSSNTVLPDEDQGLILCLIKQGVSLETILHCADGGIFVCVMDKNKRAILFGNDRFGLRPHYFSYKDKRFVLAPEMKFCIVQNWVSDELDMQSVSEYFNFQFILENRTFFKDIILFPSATIAEFNLSSCEFQMRKYWKPEDWLDIPPFSGSFDDAADEATSIFHKIVMDMTSDGRRYGIYLSGGLDSRQILASTTDSIKPIHTFTFGPKGCRDHVYASQMAKLAGTNHYPIYFNDGKWLQEIAEKHTALTECFHCLWHAHNFKDVNKVREVCDVNLSGHGGDALMGGSFHALGNITHEKLPELLGKYIDSSGIAFLRSYQFNLCKSDALPNAESCYKEFIKAIRKYEKLPNHLCEDIFYTEYRSRKLIQYFFIHNRPYFESRTPFLEKNLLKFLYSLPVGYRGNRRLQIAVLDRLNPKLSGVPWDKTNMPPTSHSWPLFKRKYVLRAHTVLHKLTKKHWLIPAVRGYNDYGNWIVDDLQDWIRDVLLQKNAIVPAFFKDGYVEWVLQNHIERGNRSLSSTFKIGTMLSLELMIRQMKNIKTEA